MATLAFPVVGHCRNHSESLGDTLFGLAMVENPGFAVGISTLSVSGITTSGLDGHTVSLLFPNYSNKTYFIFIRLYVYVL